MKIKNKKLLLSIGFNKKEIKSLKDNKRVEELIVLLSSIHIKNIRKYILKNNYLLNYNIYDLAYIITTIFNEKKNFCVVKRILTKNKYDIINEKGDVK